MQKIGTMTEKELNETVKAAVFRQLDNVTISVGDDEEIPFLSFIEKTSDGTYLIYKTDDFIAMLEELKKKSIEASANHYVRDGIDLVIDLILTQKGRQERTANAGN